MVPTFAFASTASALSAFATAVLTIVASISRASSILTVYSMVKNSSFARYAWVLTVRFFPSTFTSALISFPVESFTVIVFGCDTRSVSNASVITTFFAIAPSTVCITFIVYFTLSPSERTCLSAVFSIVNSGFTKEIVASALTSSAFVAFDFAVFTTFASASSLLSTITVYSTVINSLYRRSVFVSIFNVDPLTTTSASVRVFPFMSFTLMFFSDG